MQLVKNIFFRKGMIVMLGIILCSFIGALVYTLITAAGIVIERRDWDGFLERLPYIIISFVIEFVYMMVFLYVSCKPQTIGIALIYMWPALIVNFGISFLGRGNEVADIIVSAVLLAFSVMLWLLVPVGPVQNLIYVHDTENIDVAYEVDLEEVIAKTELNNNEYLKDVYLAEQPETREINGENVMVFHIKDDQSEVFLMGNKTQYIPGYVIQIKDESIQLISKRMYFDTSYNGKKDALRTVRRKYPSIVIGDGKFDIDDEWNPYQVYEYREKVFSSDGNDYGLILLNLGNGTCEKYPLAENKLPKWVDFTTTYPR